MFVLAGCMDWVKKYFFLQLLTAKTIKWVDALGQTSFRLPHTSGWRSERPTADRARRMYARLVGARTGDERRQAQRGSRHDGDDWHIMIEGHCLCLVFGGYFGTVKDLDPMLGPS